MWIFLRKDGLFYWPANRLRTLNVQPIFIRSLNCGYACICFVQATYQGHISVNSCQGKQWAMLWLGMINLFFYSFFFIRHCCYFSDIAAEQKKCECNSRLLVEWPFFVSQSYLWLKVAGSCSSWFVGWCKIQHLLNLVLYQLTLYQLTLEEHYQYSDITFLELVLVCQCWLMGNDLLLHVTDAFLDRTWNKIGTKWPDLGFVFMFILCFGILSVIDDYIHTYKFI